MADLEDATSPTWDNVVRGQQNLLDAVRGTLTFDDPVRGKHYEVGAEPAVLMVRPRGLHLPEAHMVVDGQPVPAALFDAGLFLFHCAHALVERGSGPYLYLPKLEHHTEARWWNDVLSAAQERLGLPVGTVKVTVLIETLPATFQLDEILCALKPHAVGLNCGRWDYIFSVIKTLRAHPDRVLPDRGAVGMTQPLMRAYTQRLVRVCHRRGVHAMGGMAAQIPIKGDPEANAAALAKVRADKEREAADGHDGTWVAHPGLVPLAREVFDRVLGDRPNQLHVTRDDVVVTADDLLQTPTGPRTEAGLRHSIRVGVHYLASWLGGQGCVPIDHLMEDAATAEICRAQVWQWVHHGTALDDGRIVTAALVQQLLTEEVPTLPALSHRDEAASLFSDLCTSVRLADFLTLPAYARLD
jgi:malate synthase